jgi:hypothetical protein
MVIGPYRSANAFALQKKKAREAEEPPGPWGLNSLAGLDQGVILEPHVNRPLAQRLMESPPQQQPVHMQVD